MYPGAKMKLKKLIWKKYTQDSNAAKSASSSIIVKVKELSEVLQDDIIKHHLKGNAT